MDAVKFMDEWARMCNACKSCYGCPITAWCGKGLREQAKYSADIVAAVEKWSAAHPRKTRQSVFLEQYPEAKFDKFGVMQICPMSISAAHRNSDGECKTPLKMCIDCRREFWMQEVE